MKFFRLSLFVILGLTLAATATWAGGRPPANAVLLFRNGDLITGDVFTVNDHSVSMLTDFGIQTYDRDEVSQLVFLENGAAMVLRAEAYLNEDSIEGELSYVGGVWDGRSAGTFTASIRTLDEASGRLVINTHYDIVRNTMPRGTLSAVTVTDGELAETGYGDYLQDHSAGVVTSGTGDFEDCYGSMDVITYMELEGDVQHMVSYHIFRFDDVH